MTCRAMIIIEHQTTADMDDNRPLPPFYAPGAIWRIVRRFPNKQTLWRRIRLANHRTHASALPPASRGPFLGGKEN
jgi:hypothetical protein